MPLSDEDAANEARAIVDANAYMTLATADPAGTPWVSPVWFAHEHLTRFLWVSRLDARHSSNIRDRREVAIVIFDSTVAPAGASAVYLEAEAGLVPQLDLEPSIATFSARSEARGAERWTSADVEAPAPHRLYAAAVRSAWILGPHDRRVAVELRR